MSNYQDEYNQQYSQSGFYESGLNMEDTASPVYSQQQQHEQQYPAQGSYYNPGMQYSQQGQGVLKGFSVTFFV